MYCDRVFNRYVIGDEYIAYVYVSKPFGNPQFP